MAESLYSRLVGTAGLAAGVGAFLLLLWPNKRNLAIWIVLVIFFVGMGIVGILEGYIA